MATAIQETQLTQFAERIYTDQKNLFVSDLAQYIKNKIETGMAQFENGQYMSMEEFEVKFRKEFLKK
jgi:predicted transcriptional regulator